MNRLSLLLVSAILLSGTVVKAGEDVEFRSFEMGDGIYMIVGAGGNLGVSIGDDGIFLIDDQYAPLTPGIRAEIRKLVGERRPVDFILNTHFHPDHTGGNENFGSGDTLIVAHENVRRRMTTDAFREGFLNRGGRNLEAALPVVTFNDRITFHVNGETLRTKFFPHAHTDGDSVVFFENANVVHVGDLFFQVGYPFVDHEAGGSVKGYIDALTTIVGMIDDDTKVIPGHGAPSDRKELASYGKMISTVFERVKVQVADGKSLEEVLASAPTREFDERWNWNFISGEKFVTTIYGELTE